MQLDDRINIETPEGVSLSLNLAGIGSRIAAGALDALLQGVAIFIAFLFLGALGGDLSIGVGIGLVSAIITVIALGYYVLFEVLNSGKTVGKMAAGIQVVRDDGSPITFSASMVRNIVRIVDALPFAFAIGLIAVFVTPKRQRLGDMAAGTIVIRYRFPRTAPVNPLPAAELHGPRWDVSAVNNDEVALLRRLFERWQSIPPMQREELVATLEQRLRSKVGAAEHLDSREDFLRRVLAEKTSR